MFLFFFVIYLKKTFSSACPVVDLQVKGDKRSTINPPTTHDSAGPAAEFPPTLPALADLSIDNKLQKGGQELIDSIFGDDSDNEIQVASKSTVFNYQILSGDNEESNRTLLQQEIHRKLHEHYSRSVRDFQLTIETVFRYIEYKKPFQTFFLICESAPYTFYAEMLEKDKRVKELRQSIINGAKKFLQQLCVSMFKFLKQLNHYRQCQNLEMNILEGLFPEVSLQDKTKFLETLNRPAILKTIFSATREEELLVNISSSKTFKSYQFGLIREITDNVNSTQDKARIVSDKNITTILHNLQDFNVTPAKLSSIRNALQEYISDDNPLPITEHRYPTRSKDEGAPIVSYFGQDSTATGKRKRSIIEDDDENISVVDNVRIEKTADNSIDVKELESLKSPVIRSEFINVSGPALLAEVDQMVVVDHNFAHNSDEPVVVKEGIDQLARHLESEPNDSATAIMDQVKVVTSPVVEEHESSRSPEIRASKCVNSSGPALLSDDHMEVVDQTFAHNIDERVVDNEGVDQLARHLESEPIDTAKTQMDQVRAVTSPVVEEHDESLRSPEKRPSECAYPAGPPASLADNQMIDEPVVDKEGIDHLARNLESEPMDQLVAENGSSVPALPDESEAAEYTFTEDDSVFLNTTSHSKVSNVKNLIVSLNHQVREIKAICARFGIDFNHLCAVEDNDNSGLDISRILFEDIDGQPNVIDLGLEEEDFVSPRVPVTTTQEIRSEDTCPKAASFIPVASTSVHDVSTDEYEPSKRVRNVPCSIKLDEFNLKRDQEGLLAKIDSFSMLGTDFYRFVGNDAYVSATFTILVYSIRHFLMTLNERQCARCLNHTSLCTYATVNIQEFLQLKSFNGIIAPLSSGSQLKLTVDHIYGTVAKSNSSSGILRSCIELRLPKKNRDVNIPLGQLQESFDQKMDQLIRDSETVLDQSIIFIDIAQPDRKGSRAANADFPVLLKRSKSDDQVPVMYQTVGAIYWSPRDTGGDVYHVSIVTRSRNQLESIMYSCFEYNVDSNTNEMTVVSKSKDIEFPSIKKIKFQPFYLKRVIMSLNLLTTTAGENGRFRLPETEIIRSGARGEIRYSDINSLLAFTVNRQDSDSWLEGNTMNEILASFAAFLKDDRNVAVDSNALHGLIQCYMKNGFVDDDSYYRFLEMFSGTEAGKLKNLFAAKDSVFHIPINHPERSHWNFGLILPEKRLIIVHDPLFIERRVKQIGSALFEFCKREAGTDTELMSDWGIQKSIKHPQQTDTVNCGVFTLISSIRAMCFIKQNRCHELLQDWNFPHSDLNIMDYRKRFAKILLNDDKELEMKRFVNMFSLKT